MGFKFFFGLIGELQKVFEKGWFGYVVLSIFEGNKIFDECFFVVGFVGFDVEVVFSFVGDDLYFFFYEDFKDF